MGLLITAGTAIAILAAVVLLPAWYWREKARVQRDELARTVRTQQEYVGYKQGLIEAVKRDPRPNAQLLMLQQHVHLPDEAPVAVEAPADPRVDQMLAARAPHVQPPDHLVMHLAERMIEPATRRGMLLVAGVLMVLAMIMFQPPEKQIREPKT
jgi:hypothetical protein